jgi:predicted DNA-binding transcriptional regulator AlpA
MQKTKKYLSVNDVAAMFGVSRTQVSRWVRGGLLTAFRPGGIGRYGFLPDEIARFEREGVVCGAGKAEEMVCNTNGL